MEVEMAELKHLDEDNFETEVLKSEGAVLVDFWAEWCAPCRMIAPVIEQISDEYAGRLTVGKLDVDAAPNLSAQLGVLSIPTVILFVGGKAAQRWVGFQPKPALQKKIDEALAAA
jgi:thioredoxin 1